MIDFRFVAIIAFIVLGGIGVLGAFASAFRVWPHNPQKRNVSRYEDVKRLYLEGSKIQQDWGESTVAIHVIRNSGVMGPMTIEKRDKEMADRFVKIIEWRDLADQSILNWFGDAACRTFLTEPEVPLDPPDWQRGDAWYTNWNQIAGRLAWLRRWLLEQDAL
jgi:hypothetical protein